MFLLRILCLFAFALSLAAQADARTQDMFDNRRPSVDGDLDTSKKDMFQSTSEYYHPSNRDVFHSPPGIIVTEKDSIGESQLTTTYDRKDLFSKRRTQAPPSSLYRWPDGSITPK